MIRIINFLQLGIKKIKWERYGLRKNLKIQIKKVIFAEFKLLISKFIKLKER